MLGCGVETSSVYQAGWDVLISLGDVLGWRLKAAVPRCGEGDGAGMGRSVGMG